MARRKQDQEQSFEVYQHYQGTIGKTSIFSHSKSSITDIKKSKAKNITYNSYEGQQHVKTCQKPLNTSIVTTQELLKPYQMQLSKETLLKENTRNLTGNHAKAIFLVVTNKPITYLFKKFLLTIELILPEYHFLSQTSQPTFLSKETTDETFQQSRKQYPFQSIQKRLDNIYEISGSQFFGTTSLIQFSADALNKSGPDTLSFIILGITQI